MSILPFPEPSYMGRTNMLVDQEYGDVLALLCEALEGPLDLGGLGLAVDDEEVPLRVRRIGDMLR